MKYDTTIKRLLVLPAALMMLVLAYVVIMALVSLRQGYAWAEMDWDGKGYTTLYDFLEAGDIGKRQVVEAGQHCVEYFHFKDGLPLKTVCPAN